MRKIFIWVLFGVAMGLQVGCSTVGEFLYEPQEVEELVAVVNPQTGETETVKQIRTVYVPSENAVALQNILSVVSGWGSAVGVGLSSVVAIGGLFINREKNRYQRGLRGTVEGVNKVLDELCAQNIGEDKIRRIKEVLESKQAAYGAVRTVAKELDKLKG